MIKPNQIKAARGMCDWTRVDLASHSGINVKTLAAIENGEVDNPRVSTVEQIKNTFDRQGIEFIDGGVREKQDKIRIMEGKDSYLKLLDEAYHHLRNNNGKKEVLFSNADQSLSSNAVIESQKRMLKAGIDLKFTVCEGDTYLLYPLPNYRYIPKRDFLNSLIVIYGDFLAVTIQGGDKVTVIRDRNIAEVFRRQFYKLWHIYKEPTEAILENKNDQV